jgi:hypothetical protein
MRLWRVYLPEDQVQRNLADHVLVAAVARTCYIVAGLAVKSSYPRLR